MGHINARGTFLIRESEQNPGGFALSIKDWEQDRSYHIKHYKIKPLDNNRGYYITTRQTFQTLPDLVKSYQTTAGESLHVIKMTRNWSFEGNLVATSVLFGDYI